jgi:threonine/homoserine/homoserine lactone efflux protein
MSEAITAALVLGISGGLTPGPLLALVISQTLRHGLREGARVAFVPLLTDTPIILFALLLAKPLASMHSLLTVISIVGAIYLMYLAWMTWNSQAPVAGDEVEEPRSIARGLAVNFLNPNPYMFWFTVGTPTLVAALRIGRNAAAVFITLFFVLLVGCQIAVAAAVARSRHHLLGRGYRWVMRGLAVMLVTFAILRVVPLIPA